MQPEYPSDILNRFLTRLGQENPDKRDATYDAIFRTFDTEDGRKTLEFLEKAVMLTPVPAGSPARALREKNAQALLIGEIRRIALYGRRN